MLHALGIPHFGDLHFFCADCSRFTSKNARSIWSAMALMSAGATPTLAKCARQPDTPAATKRTRSATAPAAGSAQGFDLSQLRYTHHTAP